MIGLMVDVRSGSVVVAGLRSPLLSAGDDTATTAAINKALIIAMPHCFAAVGECLFMTGLIAARSRYRH